MTRAPAAAHADSHVLRLSVTDRCNLRCHYCMPAGGVGKIARRSLPTLEQLSAIVKRLASEVGVASVKLTGGEPLTREGIETLVTLLMSIPAIREVSMTTNGTLLARHAQGLRRAGLRRVNISLDTLDERRFALLTRGGRLSNTLAGIEAALDAGLTPVKLNAVLLASSWREDVPGLLDLAASRGLELRLIELMRTGTEAAWAESELVTAAQVRSWLEHHGTVSELGARQTTPARRTRVRWGDGEVIVGWITPRSHPFCSDCNRLRLDARGQLRRCLMDPLALDLAAFGEDDDGLARALREYLGGKLAPRAMTSRLPMAAVGG
jgi:GTP 3',8-cyclase